MRRRQTRYSSFNSIPSKGTRASALVGSLVMVGILAMVVGVMLSSSNSAIRQSRDRILYEEAYQAAVSGTHIARAWMINPEMAADWSGSSSIESSLRNIVDEAKEMNDKIISQTDSGSLSTYDSSLFNLTRFSQLPNLGTTPDGRQIVYKFPSTSTKPLASFVNDDGTAKFTHNIFTDTPSKGHRNYVENIQITTPGFSANSETSHSLRECTFIIESRGIAEYAGTKKERVVLQRILIYPNEPTAPLLSAGAAIITDGSLAIQGQSHANVHWAPVLAKGNIALDFLAQLVKPKSKPWLLDTAPSGQKMNAAGMYTQNTLHDFDTGKQEVVDKWLKWMAGQGSQLTTNGKNIFEAIGGISVTDFFAQVARGDFAASGLTLAALDLASKFDETGVNLGDLDSGNNYGMLSGNLIDGFEGSLVQNDIRVNNKIDEFWAQMSYTELKQYAKDHNGYYVYNNGTFYDSTGKAVAGIPSMKGPDISGYYDPLAENAVADRILFIDSPNQANDPNDTIPNPPFTGSIQGPSYWKGVMFVNGNINLKGDNSVDYKIRTPDQFDEFRDDENYTGGYQIKDVFMDGILICDGLATIKSNVTIYGTLATTKGVKLDGGTPNIFYNAANGEGRLKDDESQSADFRLIAGRLTETAP